MRLPEGQYSRNVDSRTEDTLHTYHPARARVRPFARAHAGIELTSQTASKNCGVRDSPITHAHESHWPRGVDSRVRR